MDCPACQTPISVPDALAAAPYSWDSLSAIGYTCPACGASHPLRFEADRVRVIEVTAQGPEWAPLAAEAAPGTTCSHGRDALTVVYEGTAYTVPYRR